MSEVKFTKGPWTAMPATHDSQGVFRNWIYSDTYGAVGYWTGHKSNHSDARWLLTDSDANLIAAAPELYEALVHCENMLMRYSIDRIDHEDIENEALTIIRNALSKARGDHK